MTLGRGDAENTACELAAFGGSKRILSAIALLEMI